jgi:hypothetical protein
MYWPGKVNQHWDLFSKTWKTDPDGSTGSSANMLEYCQKFYPDIQNVVEYRKEYINTWKNFGNNGNYENIGMSYCCLINN